MPRPRPVDGLAAYRTALQRRGYRVVPCLSAASSLRPVRSGSIWNLGAREMSIRGTKSREEEYSCRVQYAGQGGLW